MVVVVGGIVFYSLVYWNLFIICSPKKPRNFTASNLDDLGESYGDRQSWLLAKTPLVLKDVGFERREWDLGFGYF